MHLGRVQAVFQNARVYKYHQNLSYNGTRPRLPSDLHNYITLTGVVDFAVFDTAD